VGYRQYSAFIDTVRLKEYARDMIAAELAHQDEVNKMLRKPGQTEPFVAA
jgi:bacterioferritin